MRFLPNGTPDSTFGNNGLSISYLGTNNGNVNFSEILCTSNDTKIVLGEVSNNLKAIAFSSEGVVETSYGVNGIFSDSIANGYSLKAINIDDTFFYAYQINEDSIVFKKLLPSGFLDSNFGLDGSLLLNFNNQDFAFLKSIIVLPDNCVGVVVVSSEFIKISCFSSNGILINTITIDCEIQYLSNSYIALQEDDKYIIADFFYPNNIAIKRFTNQSLVPHITYLNDSLYSNVENPVLAYQWYLNDVIINDATNASYQPSAEGTYSVTVTDTVECGYFTSTFQLETVSIPAIEDQTLLIYPNPTKDFIKVKCFNGCKSYEILDAKGCTVLRGKFNAESSIIDVSNLSNGIYMIRTDEGEVKRISVNK